MIFFKQAREHMTTPSFWLFASSMAASMTSFAFIVANSSSHQKTKPQSYPWEHEGLKEVFFGHAK